MSHIKLPNGNCVLCSAIEVTAFPKAEAINSDEKKALNIIQNSFNQMVAELYRLGEANSTSVEIMWLSEKAENQTFKSKVRAYIIIRKIGNNPTQLDSEVSAIRGNLLSALNQSKYETRLIDLSDKQFIDLVDSVDCTNLYSVVKTERIAVKVTTLEPYYTWDVMNIRSEDSLSSLITALSQCSNCAVSFQIIPTNLNQTECAYLPGIAAELYQKLDIKDSASENALKSIQYVCDRMYKPFYYYNICAFGDTESCRLIATKLNSLLQSGKETVSDCNLTTLDLSREKIAIKKHFYVYPWMINSCLVNKYRNQQIQQYPITKILGRMPYLMTEEELNVFFRLPLYDSSIPAIKQNRGIGDAEQFSNDIMGDNTIKIGTLISNDESNVYIGCPLKSWTQHALIVGMPGTGKTTFSINILNQFAKRGIPFLAIEPTKTEYRAMIDTIEDLQIFTPGNNAVSPFIINPFIPPKGITIEQYVPSLIGAFKAAFSMDGPLEMIFLKAVNACYIEYGWKKYSKFGDRDVTVFGMFEYVLCFKRIMKTMNYNKETQSNIETAGLLRLMNLIEQNSNIYDTVNTVPIEDLLCKSTVLELNAIENDEQKALIMALLLSSICVFTKNNQKGDGVLKNVILIDEAHVLLDSGSFGDNEAKSKCTTVKTIQKMIAEIRSYGTSIIIADQKPSEVTDSVVANTNIKVSFRLTSPKERNLIAESTDMNNSNSEYLTKLNVGQAFVYFDRLNSPQLVQTEDTRERDGIRLSVDNEEIIQRSTYWNDKHKNLIPFLECNCSSVCDKCSFKVRNDSEYYASKLLDSSISNIREKKSLFAYAVRIPKVLSKNSSKYNSKELKQLFNCTIIKYIRKAELALPFTVSMKELKNVIDISANYLKGQ